MLCADDIEVKINLKDINKLSVSCYPQADSYQYAFQLYCNDTLTDRVLYSEQPETLFWLSKSGEYKVRACIKEETKSVARFSSFVHFINEASQLPEADEKKIGLFQKVGFVWQEIQHNFIMLIRIAGYDYKLLNKDSYLGKLWSFLTPLTQIAVYWLVFGLGIRNGSAIDGYPFLLWMLCGLVPWFFINESIMKGANSIYSKANVVTKMKYPIATVPISVVVTAFMEHIAVMIILFATLVLHGYYPTLHYLNLIYYMIYNFVFLCSLSLITSVLTMIARDFQKLLASIIRLLFYITPILWSMDRMPDIYQNILQFNPVLYVVSGFRDSLLYQVNFYEHPLRITFFWMINLLMFLLGCSLQYKYRTKFNDLM